MSSRYCDMLLTGEQEVVGQDKGEMSAHSHSGPRT